MATGRAFPEILVILVRLVCQVSRPFLVLSPGQARAVWRSCVCLPPLAINRVRVGACLLA